MLNIRDYINWIDTNIRASYHDGNFNASVGFGVSFAGRAAGSGARGWEYRRSFGAGWDDGHQGFGVYSTIFSGFGGKFNQQIGGLSYRNGDFGFRYENDGAPFSNTLGDGHDSYRTAAVQISYQDYTAGFNLFTGERTYFKDDDDRVGHVQYGIFGERYPNGFVNEGEIPYRLGAAYIGYKGYRLGLDSDRYIRHPIQDMFAHNIRLFRLSSQQPGFRSYSNSITSYFQYRSYNPYTLW